MEGFDREALHAAISARDVVKTTIMRVTLHLAAASDYPAYAQLARQARMRTWRNAHPDLDEQRVIADLRRWLERPRSNDEIRDRVSRYEGVPDEPWAPIMFARTLLPLVQLPPAGFADDRTRARFVADPRPLPDPAEAATLVLQRYLSAFGPAGKRDVAAWAGVAQRDFATAWERLTTVSYRDEKGTELHDLPGAPLPPASTPLPVRLLARWDQALLAYADRERIMPLEVRPLKLTLSGDSTVTVDGRVAASWLVTRERGGAVITVTPHVEIRRRHLTEIRAEAERTARFVLPDAPRREVRVV